MTDRAGANLLDEVALFSSCTRTELGLLGSITTAISVRPGTVVMTEDGPGRECFVIAGGRARATRDGETVAVLGPGEFFGEMSLLVGAPRAFTVVAETPMELYVISPAEFDSLLATAPSIVRKMLRERRRAEMPSFAV